MKNYVYIFSNTKLNRKNNTFVVELIENKESINKIDIDESEKEFVLLPIKNSGSESKQKFIPAESIDAFFTFGEILFNTQFFKCLSNYNIQLHMFGYYGDYIGSFLPKKTTASGSIEILQYEAYCNETMRLYIAKAIVLASIKNILNVLKSYSYSGADLSNEISKIISLLEMLRFTNSIEELIGYEGAIRNIYYQSWKEIFKKDVNFSKREKRPSNDMINSLISFGNAILYSVCLNEIYRTRLNPFLGFVHESGDNQHPLVYDIADIYKPVIVDRVIFRTINLKILDEEDFESTPKGYFLKDEARKKFVEEIENRLNTVIHYKKVNRKMSYRSIIRLECYNLINYLTKKVKSYEAFVAE